MSMCVMLMSPKVHQIDYDEESNSISKSVYLHKEGEIWSLSSSTFSHELIATVYNKVAIGKARHQAAVWKLPASGGPQTPIEEPSLHFPELIKIAALGAAGDSDEFGDMKGFVAPNDSFKLNSNGIIMETRSKLWHVLQGAVASIR